MKIPGKNEYVTHLSFLRRHDPVQVRWVGGSRLSVRHGHPKEMGKNYSLATGMASGLQNYLVPYATDIISSSENPSYLTQLF